ncbi:MAG: phage tail protein [Saprospiraceae bacterium]|nr:phage tail protein [Saprospiraceae bacterium]
MGIPYVGEIRIFAGNFAPSGWMFCEGQLLPISENETLFQLIGTTYGGDGEATFALPDFRGRIPIHQGNGFILAETGGAEEVTLTLAQIPAHTHSFLSNDLSGGGTSPAGSVLARNTSTDSYTNDTSVGLQALNAGSILPTGGSQPHTNFQPYTCINFIISLFGIFPTQN